MTLQRCTKIQVMLIEICLHLQTYYCVFTIFLSQPNNFTIQTLRIMQAAVFQLMVQTYVFYPTRIIYLFITLTPTSRAQIIASTSERWQVTMFNIGSLLLQRNRLICLLFLILVIYFLFRLTRNTYTINCKPLSIKGNNSYLQAATS